MFYKVLFNQLSNNFKNRMTWVTMIILFTLVGLNYVFNIQHFSGMDLIKMYHPMKLLLLSYNRSYYNCDLILFLVQLYPVLVSCPGGLMLTCEKQTGLDKYIITRIGSRKYIASRILASFIVTSFVFTLPFIVEIFLNCIAFPIKATGDILNYSIYDSEYAECINNYLFPLIYQKSSYLYAVIHTFLFGIFSGILGAFSTSISIFFKYKYRVVGLLPAFLLLELFEYIRNASDPHNYALSWYNYFLLFSDLKKNNLVFFIVLFIIIGITILLSYLGSRRDCL